jgi:hypothetical protein
MKKIKLNPEKLQLKKEKIANLTQEQMNNANGGGILWSRIGCCKSVFSAKCPTKILTECPTDVGICEQS